jgi:predicted nucleic acid-binding Zn ribbon protein
MPEIKFCPYCSSDIVKEAKFCYECGKDLTSFMSASAPATTDAPDDDKKSSSLPDDDVPATKHCRYCGAIIATDAQFCRKCGANLSGTASTRARAPPSKQRPKGDGSELFNESYRRSGHEVLTPFHKTVEDGVVRFGGTTRHPNGHTLEITIYVAKSYSEAQQFKEDISNEYQVLGYETHKMTDDAWMGVNEDTLVSVVAKQTSALGVPTTMVVSTPL